MMKIKFSNSMYLLNINLKKIIIIKQPRTSVFVLKRQLIPAYKNTLLPKIRETLESKFTRIHWTVEKNI